MTTTGLPALLAARTTCRGRYARVSDSSSVFRPAELPISEMTTTWLAFSILAVMSTIADFASW